MQTLSMLLVGIGYIGVFVASIWLLVVAFQESVLWGLGCLFIPIVSLVFVVMHWPEAKRPFCAWLIACVPLILGTIISRPQ